MFEGECGNGYKYPSPHSLPFTTHLPHFPMRRHTIFLPIAFICYFLLPQTTQAQQQPYFTIMAIEGTSDGKEEAPSYLYPLWEKLFEAGYLCDFIGPQKAQSRIGALNYAALNANGAKQIQAKIDSLYKKYPADLLLMQQQALTKESQQSLISRLKSINPNVQIVILSAQLTTDKTSNYPTTHVIPAEDEQNAIAWLQAIEKVMKTDRPKAYHPQKVCYKTLPNGDTLNLHIFTPLQPTKNNKKRPAIVYFFGGGWVNGTPLQFYRECNYYAQQGFMAIAVDYRIKSIDSTSPFDSFSDAKDAMRWIRQHAQELQIDPERIAAAGASAGGQLAAALGCIGSSDTERADYAPNLLLLYYPVIDNSPGGYGPSEMKKRYTEISPLHNIHQHVPPTLFLLGTKDRLIPMSIAEQFKKKLEENNVECELHFFPGAGHPIFSYRQPTSVIYDEVRRITDSFLQRHGFEAIITPTNQ